MQSMYINFFLIHSKSPDVHAKLSPLLIFIHMESLAFGNFKYNTLYSSRTVDASVYTNSQYEAHRFEDRLTSRSAENLR